MTDDSTSADKLQGGDQAAFEELFRRYHPDLVAFATRLTGAKAVAEEIVQDVLLSMWCHRERGDATPDSILAYLVGAVRKTATSYLRDRTACGGSSPVCSRSPTQSHLRTALTCSFASGILARRHGPSPGYGLHVAMIAI